MSTPRTDAATLVEPYLVKELPFEVVKADDARQLETELQAMTALADRLAEALGSFCVLNHNSPRVKIRLPTFIHHGREAIAAYEAHKKGDTP